MIACYKPKPGMQDELRALMPTHVPFLRGEGLATDRHSIVMETKNGTILEVFEWESTKAIESAHSNPTVLEMWGKYAEVCDYVPVGTVEEAATLFSEFTPFKT